MASPSRAHAPLPDSLRHTRDIVIIGGGFAGSLTALVLARQGLAPIVVDLYDTYPSDFRAEKFSTDQLRALHDLGVLDVFGDDPAHLGLRYDAMVNALRRHWPDTVTFIPGKVTSLTTSAARQQATLSDGQVLDSRLIVLATGPGEKLRSGLGLQKYILSAEHSVCIGFSLKPDDPDAFPAEGLIAHGDKAGDGVGFANLFPLAAPDDGFIRVNLFLYDDRNAERVRRFRQQPVEELLKALPKLRRRLPPVTLSGQVEVRVSDLYDVTTPKLPGIVLIGDARRTSCPATGTGITRILNDVKDLSRTFAPQWLEMTRIEASATRLFYADEHRCALDADMHRRSLRGRDMALNTSLYWQMRRMISPWMQQVRARMNGAAPAPVAAKRLFTNDLVQVKRASEILATLDGDGALEGMPFMPEMTAYIGREMRVHRRADRTCVEGHGLRKLDDTVFLETARCDGAAHDGCQRDCLMFWKEAWLRPAGVRLARTDDLKERSALKALEALTTRSGGHYTCQSTRLDSATQHLSKMHLGAMLNEVREGEMAVREFLRLAFRALANKLRAVAGLPDMGMVLGESGEKTRGALGLKPGDWVRIRDIEAIRATVGPHGRNLGLSFEPEMTRYVGHVRQVDRVVERIIHEETGDMVRLGQTVTLKNLYCQGYCAKACPRTNPLFWREIWLERVEGPDEV